MPSGILIIDKPEDWTSHDVIAKLRGALRERRMGHAGTLDPMATGVLPIFLGRATRAVEFATEGEKEYITGLRLGTSTDTQDTTGTVKETKPVSITEEELKAALAPFLGDIFQIPPMFSAIKIKGKKLYELARAGKEVERQPRPVTIHDIEILSRESDTDFLLRIRCSKGTYVRTLCHDIGNSLGVGGCMYSLRRTMAAGFSLDNAYTLAEVLAHENPQSLLSPVEDYFANYPILTVKDKEEKKVRNGLAFSYDAPDGQYRVYNENQSFLMLGEVKEGKLLTVKSFFEV